MTGSVQGGGDLSPQDRVLYRQEFERAVNLFQQSLTAYEQSQMQSQKDEFKNVMAKTLEVIRQTIRQAVSQRPDQKEEGLATDYQKFLASDTPENVQRLNDDLNDLKSAR